MVSSALYRYFPSRDELLTALIIDAYDALGDAAEAAGAGRPAADIRGRWAATCHAVRNWALAHPHEYALIYGSPVPGYQAPQATVTPAARVARVAGGLVADAWREAREAGGGVRGPDGDAPAADGRVRGAAVPLPPELAEQAAMVADAIAPGVPEPVIARLLIAWTQLFGMISFELFGQLVGSADPADAFFGYAVEQMADFIGLP